MKISHKDLMKIIREEAESQEEAEKDQEKTEEDPQTSKKDTAKNESHIKNRRLGLRLSRDRMQEIIREELQSAKLLREEDNHVNAVTAVINRLNGLSPGSDASLPSQFKTDMQTLDSATDALSPGTSGSTTFSSSSGQAEDQQSLTYLIQQARDLRTDLQRMKAEG